MRQEEIEDIGIDIDENEYKEIFYQLVKADPELQNAPNEEIWEKYNKTFPVNYFDWYSSYKNSSPQKIASVFLAFIKRSVSFYKEIYEHWHTQYERSYWEDDLINFIRRLYSRFSYLSECQSQEQVTQYVFRSLSTSKVLLVFKSLFWLNFLLNENRTKDVPHNFIQFLTYVYSKPQINKDTRDLVDYIINTLIEYFPQLENPIQQYFRLIKRDFNALRPTRKIILSESEIITPHLPAPSSIDNEDVDTEIDDNKKVSHFNMPLNGEQVKYLYNELKGIYIANDTDFDLFCYCLIGKSKPEQIGKIIWLKGKENLVVFIGLLAESSQKWKLTENFFIIPKQNLKNLATYYTRYSMKKKDITIKQIVENCKKKEF